MQKAPKRTLQDDEADGLIAPGFLERSSARVAAERAWQELKRLGDSLGDAEVVSAIDQQMRVALPHGEVKLWRKGSGFAFAFEGKVLGVYPPEQATVVLQAIGENFSVR
jgi:hypothetical protein